MAMKALQDYTIRNLEKEQPSKLAIMVIMAYFALILFRHKEVYMSEVSQNQEQSTVDQTKPQAEKVGFLTKAKDFATKNETFLKVLRYVGAAAVVAGLIVAIAYGLGAIAYYLIGGGLAGGLYGYYFMPNRPKLLPSGSLEENVQKIMHKLGIEDKQQAQN
jgi:hypothetical protein